MKFQSNSIFNGKITANSVADAGTNTDKFLVLSSNGDVSYRTAAELYIDLGIGSLPAGYTSTLKHQVKAGVALTKGQAVYVTSADGTNMIVGKASNGAESTSSKTLGLIETSLSNNGIGNVITEGLLAGLDTTGANAAGDPVWLGTNGNLIYGLLNKPSAPAHLVFIGVVTRVNANNGEIFVKVQNGFEMGELHNYAESGVQNNDIITWESSTSLYKPKSIATILGYTPVPTTRTLTINGTAYDLSADRSWTISANINARTEYEFTTDGSSATYNATYTVGQVDVFYNGSKLASTEFTATTGTSVVLGFTPPSGQVVEVVAWETGGGVSNGRTLTINGVSYDLSADRSWTISSGISGSGTTNYLPKWSSSTGLGNSNIYDNGNYLGIKTTNPLADLHVYNGSAAASILLQTNSSTDYGEIAVRNAAAVATSYFRQYSSSVGGTLFGVSNNNLACFFSNYASNFAIGTLNGGDLIFATANTERMRITNSTGAATFSSSVTAAGINSTIAKSGTSVESINLLNLRTTGTGAIGDSQNIRFLNTDGIHIANIAGILGGDNTAYGSLAFSIRSYNTDAMYEAMRINNRGNVGIGTSSPVNYSGYTSLHIAGATSTGSSILYLTNSTSSIRGLVYAEGTQNQITFGSQSNHPVTFVTNDTERMRITSAGNVGIGTSSPDEKLTIIGGNVSISSTRRFYLDSGAGYLYLTSTGNNGAMQFYTGDTERMRITSGGQVGIGTSGPATITEINKLFGTGSTQYDYLRLTASQGGAWFSQLGIQFRWNDFGNGAAWNMSSITGYVDGWTAPNAGGGLIFYTKSFGAYATDPTERMRITSGGNVGIGTSSINYKLEVVNSTNQYVFHSFNSRNTSGDANVLFQLGNNCNNTGSYFLVASMPLGDRMYIYGNGNIVNINGSYGTLSDINLKENIVNATPKLADILQLKVRNFNLIGEETKQIGFIAQEFEEVFPSMVDIDGKTGMKTIKTSVLTPMHTKAIQELYFLIQEQQQQIEELKARLN